MCSIMGQTNTIVQQMVSYYNARATYPAFYANTEAPTIEAFCRLYIEESKMENVRAEVAFCQAMKETGFLRYGGKVKIEQYNFAGLGSTGAGVAGASPRQSSFLLYPDFLCFQDFFDWYRLQEQFIWASVRLELRQEF